MNKFSENEIQVLGQAPTPTHKPGPHRTPWVLIALLVVVVLGLSWLVGHRIAGSQAEEADTLVTLIEQQVEQQAEQPIVSAPNAADTARVSILTDSINNVAFRLFALPYTRPQLMMHAPDSADTSLLLAVPAADFRRDNQGIVGDFVLSGEQLARGQRKEGYLAIVDGKMAIGNSATTEMRDYCIDHGGSFFRQYLLVFDGQVQENRLKGKAQRRALAQREAEWYVVESLERESLYDFSEALADYGFTNALYLVGANRMLWLGAADADTLEYAGQGRHPNYLVFRR